VRRGRYNHRHPISSSSSSSSFSSSEFLFGHFSSLILGLPTATLLSSVYLASCLYLRVIVPIQCEPMLSVSGHVGFSDDGKRWKMDCHNGRHRLCSTFDETRSASRRAVRVTKCLHHGLMFRCLCNATILTAYLLYLNAERQSLRGHGKTHRESIDEETCTVYRN